MDLVPDSYTLGLTSLSKSVAKIFRLDTSLIYGEAYFLAAAASFCFLILILKPLSKVRSPRAETLMIVPPKLIL